MTGPCLCGDPSCPHCGDPSAAAFDAQIEKLIDLLDSEKVDELELNAIMEFIPYYLKSIRNVSREVIARMNNPDWY